MLTPVHEALASLCKMSAQEAAAFVEKIASTSRNDLVKAQWSVTYDELGHDMISVADVSLVYVGDALLQVWLRNAAAGIWIPELQPWEISVVEFKPEQSITSAKLGLLDSEWTGDDMGREYHYQLWGFVFHNGKAESFAFDKWAVYPGDA
jgi:hypothetical protein